MTAHLGILGGMFDPVHVGHVKIALAAKEFLNLDQVRLIPCNLPNHREQAICSPQQRLDMLRLATGDYPFLVIDDQELRREGKSYTVDTLSALQESFPNATLYFLLGMDAFASLPSWHRWRSLFDYCHFIVIRRPGFSETPPTAWLPEIQARLVQDKSELATGQSGQVLVMDGLAQPLSSSLVREKLRRGDSVRDFLTPAVADYLVQHQLYTNPTVN